MARALILGVSGLLGNTLFRYFHNRPEFCTLGTVRSPSAARLFPRSQQASIRSHIDVGQLDSLIELFSDFRPDVVINAIGVVKQHESAVDPLAVLPINSLLPHRLAKLCAYADTRLVHISTDCVFDGKKGNYSEDDAPTASDLYGRSKLLGEVDYANVITLRTSIIGHELSHSHGLIEWFLTEKRVKGFARAIFSGLPTVELANVIANRIIPNKSLRGIYHVAAEPISKLDLLRLVASAYAVDVKIEVDDSVVIDRSLNYSRFQLATGYVPPGWPELVARMRDFH